ncbi:MAG TPA: class I SAM-dependent methyltransferase [Nodosilinea sp.]|nr:class I SAM-dependent methyltransferase [Nodosilinea sp.]
MTTLRSETEIIAALTAYARQDPEYRQFASVVGAHQYRLLYGLCDRYLPPGGQVLDWGCGHGHFSYYLLHRGYETHGFAFVEFPLLPELAAGGFHFWRGRLEEPVALPYGDGRFDGVVSVGVLEHVREHGGDEVASLREIRRLLKPEGVFICYHFPNRYSLIELAAARLPDKYHHPYRYTRADIDEFCRQAQFELLAVGRYGLLPRNMFGHLGALGQRRWVARGWDGCDRTLSQLFSPLCQNYYFVARPKP